MKNQIATLKKTSDRISIMTEDELEYMQKLLNQDNNASRRILFQQTLSNLNNCLDELERLYFGYKKRKKTLI